MSIPAWFARSVGRVREGTKVHLVMTAELVSCSNDVLHAMRGATDEECETLLVDHISKTCGGTADWKEHPHDIAETLAEFLSADEADLLRRLALDERTKPAQAVQRFDALLTHSPKGVRALESFGDFYIVLVVPRPLLPRFDEVNKHWIALAEA